MSSSSGDLRRLGDAVDQLQEEIGVLRESSAHFLDLAHVLADRVLAAQEQLGTISAEVSALQASGPWIAVADPPVGSGRPHVPLGPVGVSRDHPPAGSVRKWYVVTTPAPGRLPGLYHTWSAFADAVRDPEFYFSGKSKLPFAAGTRSESFPTRQEAEAHWLAVKHCKAIFVHPQ